MEQLFALLHLSPGSRVLEIATGKGEFLIRLAEQYDGIIGVGNDISPFCIADAQKKHQERVPDTRLSFLEMDGADYSLEKPESFDLVACIGASWDRVCSEVSGSADELRASGSSVRAAGSASSGSPKNVLSHGD